MLFSIIVPIYNVEKYLRECLDSIQNQSFNDFEVILVNDGSTDSSPEICKEYVRSDKRFQVIHKQNGGQSSARNIGVKSAKGEYLIFIDSDDFFTSTEAFAIIAEELASRPDILSYQYYKYYSAEKKSFCGIKNHISDNLDKSVILKELISKDGFFCSCWSKTIKRNIIIENNIIFDETSSCEDMDWYLRVIQASNTIKVISQPLINYRQREGSVTSGGFRLKNLKDYIRTIDYWHLQLKNKALRDDEIILLNALGKLYCNLLISYSSNKDKALCLKNAIFKHKSLLKYSLNPRTSRFKKGVSLLGIDLFTSLLHIYFITKR